MEIAMRLRALGSRLLVLALFCGCGSALAQSGADTALYWELSRDGQPAGFLLGTIHSEDPRVLEFPEAFIGQLKSNRAFAMEMVPDLPTLTRLTEYMHYQDGSLLEQRIGAERFARVRAALSDYRVPADWVARMKIWAAMMTLSVPPPRSGLFMDFSLSLRAAGSGLKVVGLETLEQQLSFLENMPEEQQLDLLDQALDEYESVQDVHDRMVASYLAGDLQALSRQVEEQLAELTPEARRYFMAEGIAARNGRMLAALLPLLEEGRVFAAVGALHLPGEAGLIAGLRRHGYALQPLPLPFSAAQGGGQAEKQGSHKTADAP